MEKYFLAANSAEGFVSSFEDNYLLDGSWRAYIIKGGPGTGKSSFMKYMARKAEEKGYSVTLCPCSSDPDSLDGVIIPEQKVIFLDGTAPHVVEPKFAGVCEEILNLGQFWQGDKLRENKDKIFYYTEQNKLCHKRASAYFKAAGSLIYDNIKLSKSFTNHDKLADYCENLCRKLIPVKRGTKGREWVRFLRGSTPKGVIFYKETLENYQNKIIVEDKYGAVSSKLMNTAREIALSRGYEIISLKNSFLPSVKYDHIIIPELSLVFATEDDYAHINDTTRRIHARRFYDLNAIKKLRPRISFNRRVAEELLIEGCEALKKAKEIHDKLEAYYINSMDFGELTEYATKIAKNIIK